MHIGLTGLMLLFSGGQLVRLAIKWFDPTNDNVRSGTPGVEMAAFAVAFAALLGILACSLGLLRSPSMRLLLTLHGAWLVCFTSIGWTDGGPFRLQEVVGIDIDDPSVVRNAELLHLLGAMATYFCIALVIGLPLILRWRRQVWP